uniref:Cytochrome P450 n=1 Tax=Quercus lobata TaxID=97700 RepID=A0A7N2R339_QUELO
MDLPLLLLKVSFTIALVGFVSKLIQICDTLILKPERLRSKLRRQGIRGPPPSFLLGNINDMKKMRANSSKTPPGEQAITHNCSSALFPLFELWSKEYGSTFMFSLGNIQILHMNHPDVVKEISICTSLDLGKPSYQHKERGPLLGHGILTSNGATWAHQRKILAPELYMEKVKDMMNLMVESSITLVNSWTNLIESEGGVADVHVDEYMRSFSGDVISRACFGSNYSKGEEIFLKLRELQEQMSKKVLLSGIPVLRYLPTKSNRETWRLQKEVRALIMKVVKERKEGASQNDLLQMIIEGATNSDFGQDETDRFIVDNCKNIYLAGYETTAVSATWTLMLLASNPEWQQRVRSEVLEICADQMPNADMVRKMKTHRKHIFTFSHIFLVTKQLYNIIYSSKHKQNPEKNHQIRTNEGEIAIGEIAIGAIVIGAVGASRSAARCVDRDRDRADGVMRRSRSRSRRRRDASIAIAINAFARSRSLRSTHCDRRRDASIAIAIDAFARSRSLRSTHGAADRDRRIAFGSAMRRSRSTHRDRAKIEAEIAIGALGGWIDRSSRT